MPSPKLILTFAFACSVGLVLGACGDDDHATDGGLADGALPDGALPDGALPDGASPDGGPVGPTITICPDDTLTPPAGANCTVTAGSGGTTLLVGDVLTPGEVFRGGHVLIDATGTITCAGCDCADATATRIECPDAAISPA